jgi:class 3 adenylate cyclase
MNATPDNTVADPEQIIADLRRQLAEAREQQAATAEVLHVINSSPGDLAPVFAAILEKAHSLCGADTGSLQLYDGEFAHAIATRGLPGALEEILRRPRRSSLRAREAFQKGERFIQITDLADPELTGGEKTLTAAYEIGGVRTLLMVPLRTKTGLLGLIVAGRLEVTPFSPTEISLLRNFAVQAVIAMENARLINETREALGQQTATAEVLQVINSSPGNLAPVFDAMLERAICFCQAAEGLLTNRNGDEFEVVATRSSRPEMVALSVGTRFAIDRETVAGRAMLEGRTVHIRDVDADPDYRNPRLGKVGTLLGVPLLREGVVVGSFSLARERIEAFTEKHIAVVENFAAQAVLAMENARLLTETREALEQQTATAEVLQVINSSPGNLTPVFEAMLDRALALCDAAFGIMLTFDGRQFHHGAVRGVPEAFAEYRARNLPVFGPETSPGRHRSGENIVHFPDMMALNSYKNREPGSEVVDLGGARTLLSVALRSNTDLLGTLAIYRQEVRPFSDKQIGLLQNFAAQAVIAMENARLLTETREALEQQTATAEVLQVINSSPGDLTPVFEAMLDKALRLCEASLGGLGRFDGECFHPLAVRGFSGLREPVTPQPGSASHRLVSGERIVHIPDITDTAAYRAGVPSRRTLADVGGARTALWVALHKDGALLGHFVIYRREVRPFSDKQIALLQNFAAQAVIAMENARLLGELRQRTEEVAELNRGLEAQVAEQVEELGRVGRLKRFLAPQLAELIVSQDNEKILESHRREIVVVFCDLRGYTGFTETAEPEEVLDFLRDYHGALGPLVAQFEGTLDQFSGDGIMVFFNDPVPIPDPAERAVNMAVAMRQAAGELIERWRPRGCELGFGVGIAWGYATLGQIGFADRSGYTAIGTVCNLAARLCDEAKDAQILVTGRVAAAVGPSVVMEEVGNLSLKGLSRPVAAFNVGQNTSPAEGRPNLTLVARGPGV